jgi:hypothetical protein
MKIGNYNVQVDANGDLIEWEDDEFDVEEDDLQFASQLKVSEQVTIATPL